MVEEETRLPLQELQISRFGNMVEEETRLPLQELQISRFESLPFSSEESPKYIILNTRNFCKTESMPIIDETMSQSSKSPCNPQEENDRAITSKTEEQNMLFSVEERNCFTSMSKGSNDNSLKFAEDNIDTVGGKLDSRANTGSQDNTVSAEGPETNSDNNYGHGTNVPSSQILKTHTFKVGKIDNSSSLDTISKNSSHFCSQPSTTVTIGSEPYEDTFEKQGSQTNDVETIEDIYTDSSIAGSGDNSSNLALDDNLTLGSRLDESAKACSEDKTISLEDTEPANNDNHANGMGFSSSQVLKNHTSTADKTGNGFLLLDTRPEDSSPFSNGPNANVTVSSGLHEDTLEVQKPAVTGLENNVADNTSMFATFGMDKTKGKKYSQDKNKEPTISKMDKEQNALFVSQNAKVIENNYIASSSHEDDDPTNSGFIDYDAVNSKLDNFASAGSRGNPISAEGTELGKTTYENDLCICSSQAENNISRASKTEEQNALSTDNDTVVIENESVASSSQGSNGNSLNWIVLDDKYPVSVGLDSSANASSQDNISCAEESGGNCGHGIDTSLSQMLKTCTSMVDKTSSSLNTRSKQSSHTIREPYPNVTVVNGLHEASLERQKPDARGPECHAKDKAQLLATSEKDSIKNENLSCESQGEMVPIPLKTEQEERELAETNDKNFSYESQDEQRPRGLKTKEEQHALNIGPDITEQINYSNHASDDKSANFSDAVVGRLENSTNEGSSDNTSSPEDTELNNHGGEIKIQSNQELMNPICMDDKMESNCPLDARPNKSSSFSNQSHASAIEDSKRREDTIEDQKPVVRDSESLVENKTLTNLELPHGISSDNVLEHKVSKISSNNTDNVLGNEVDFNASETQTLDSSPSEDNRDTMHMVAASVLKSSKNQKKSSKSQNTDGATRQSNLKVETKTRRQKSPKLGRKSKSNVQDKSERMLQPKRGEKAFNENNRANRTPKTYSPEKDASNFKENSYKEKADVTRIESIRSMGSEKLSWAAVVKWLAKWLAKCFKWAFFLYLIQVFVLLVYATPVPELAKWQRYVFCTDDYDLLNQSLVIKSMDDIRRPGCDFVAPAVPHFYNCSILDALVFLNNKTCLEMFTKDLRTQIWDFIYGKNFSGDGLKSVRGGLFSDEQVMAKVYQSTTTPEPLSTNGTTSKSLDRPTWSRIIGLLLGIVSLILVLVLVFFFAK